MKVLFFGDMASHIGEAMRCDDLNNHELVFLNETSSDEDIINECSDTDVLVSMIFDKRFSSDSIKMVHVPGIGVDKINFDFISGNTQVLTCGAHEMAVTEYVLASIINWNRDFNSVSKKFSENDWSDCSRLGGSPQKDLESTIIGVIGSGNIGRKIMDVASRFGSRLLCLTRYPYQNSLGITFYSRNEIDDFVSESDVIVIACALDSQSKNLLNDSSIKKMKKNALLINVARGECVDYESLYLACKECRISGAVLDVWNYYPVKGNISPQPASPNFGTLNNVIMTPHISAWTTSVVRRRAEIIRESILGLEQ